MKLFVLVFAILMIGSVIAQDSVIESAGSASISYSIPVEFEGKAGVTPGNIFYGFDLFFENLRLKMARTDEKKAALYIKYSEERLAE
ncbi:hypothetical protein J4456_00860 [Candidatus Pacearchaeota archaeon]|nr:hypothetical protein [Candidatus Pacearchaeota archaeon]